MTAGTSPDLSRVKALNLFCSSRHRLSTQHTSFDGITNARQRVFVDFERRIQISISSLQSPLVDLCSAFPPLPQEPYQVPRNGIVAITRNGTSCRDQLLLAPESPIRVRLMLPFVIRSSWCQAPLFSMTQPRYLITRGYGPDR